MVIALVTILVVTTQPYLEITLCEGGEYETHTINEITIPQYPDLAWLLGLGSNTLCSPSSPSVSGFINFFTYRHSVENSFLRYFSE